MMTSYFLVLIVQIFKKNVKLSPKSRFGFIKWEMGVLYRVFDYDDEP